jgi:hypothetical protein
MLTIVGYKINREAFEDITKDILLQNKERYDIHEDINIHEAAYDFIVDEEFNDHKDTYFPGISSLKNIVITRYCGDNMDTIHVGYIVNRGNKNAIKKKHEELEAFKNLCPPHLLASEEADTFTFEEDVAITTYTLNLLRNKN